MPDTLSSQAIYRQFCASAPADFPLFMQPWYLDTVCGDGWQAVTADANGHVVAVWPYFLKQKWHWRYVAMPLLGKFMGPYITPEYRSLDWQMRLMTRMWQDMPKGLAAFEQDFPYWVQNWLPLYWQGFRQTTRYSYALDLTKAESELWAGISRNYQKKIERAQAQLTIRHDLPFEELYRVAMLSFDRQGKTAPITRAWLAGIYEALKRHNAVQTFFAMDNSTGAVHSASMLVWDRESAYYLIGGDDPALRQSGSGVLLQWAAIRYAQQTVGVPIFDFEGSMLPTVEPTRREFGAWQRPYFRLQQENSWIWRIGKMLRRV
jgi:hypothetical protein